MNLNYKYPFHYIVANLCWGANTQNFIRWNGYNLANDIIETNSNIPFHFILFYLAKQVQVTGLSSNQMGTAHNVLYPIGMGSKFKSTKTGNE